MGYQQRGKNIIGMVYLKIFDTESWGKPNNTLQNNTVVSL
jgi:hypothetical protein